jgi:hypothetical protein
LLPHSVLAKLNQHQYELVYACWRVPMTGAFRIRWRCLNCGYTHHATGASRCLAAHDRISLSCPNLIGPSLARCSTSSRKLVCGLRPDTCGIASHTRMAQRSVLSDFTLVMYGGTTCGMWQSRCRRRTRRRGALAVWALLLSRVQAVIPETGHESAGSRL